MKKPKLKYDLLLFVLLMVLLFVPIVQEWAGIFPVKPLKGAFEHRETIGQKAKERNLPVEVMLEKDAQWVIDQQMDKGELLNIN